ncbi:hypothetical protein [Streptomyces sp. NPDC051569]|uniref:hypothetical protein n=1 Tax=Streptomyces sp. NPDC051569 TaxID=3365661 RepID=UPI00378CA97C
MVRNVIGSVLALAGAAAAVLSPFRAWYDGRHGSDIRVADLFNGVTGNSAALGESLLLPVAFAALVTLIGVALRSRPPVALAGLVVLGFTILWMVRQGMAAGSLSVDGHGGGLGLGVAYSLGGGLVLLLAAVVMSGRRRYGRPSLDDLPPMVPVPDGPAPQDWDPPYGAGPYGSQQYGSHQNGAQPYGAQPYGAQPYGSGPYGSGPYDSGPYGAHPYASERDRSHPDEDTQTLGTVGPGYDDADPRRDNPPR